MFNTSIKQIHQTVSHNVSRETLLHQNKLQIRETNKSFKPDTKHTYLPLNLRHYILYILEAFTF